MVVPSFLEQSMIAFAKEQERFREQMNAAMGKGPMEMMKTPMKAIEEQARRNIELFQNAMRLFTPFPGGAAQAPSVEAGRSKDEEKSEELSELKKQIAAMQRKIDSMG
jgi:polyhydroxyalkanoate synthesis regulator protein